MTPRLHADPYVAIGGWDRQTRGALQIFLRFQAPVFRCDIAGASADTQATDARLCIRYINEPGLPGLLRRFSRDATEFVGFLCRFERHREWLLAGQLPRGLWSNTAS